MSMVTSKFFQKNFRTLLCIRNLYLILTSISQPQPYHKNIYITNSTLWHLNGLLNPTTGAIDMFWQSDFCGQICSLPLTVRCPKSLEIRHFWRPYVSFLDIKTTVSTWTGFALQEEAFAHMYECLSDRIRYKQMKEYFPTALKYFEDMLKRIW